MVFNISSKSKFCIFSFLLIFLSAVFVQSSFAQTRKFVKSTDFSQKNPSFISASLATVGTPKKLRITICRDWAFIYQKLTDSDIPGNANQLIRACIDIVDENGNIANKEAKIISPLIMIKVNAVEGGTKNTSYTIMPPPINLNLNDTGTVISIYNSEAESLTLTASATGFTTSDPVVLTFKESISIFGNLSIPANSAATSIDIGAFSNDDPDMWSSKSIFIETGKTLYPFKIDALAPGAYKIMILPVHNKNITDLGKYIKPVCGNESPFNYIFLDYGWDLNVKTITMSFSGRGGIKGKVSIDGRAAGDLSDTVVRFFPISLGEDFCNLDSDMLVTLQNSSTQTDGDEYFIPNMQAGKYRMNVYVENLLNNDYEWFAVESFEVKDGKQTTINVNTKLFTGEYSEHELLLHTLYFNAPVDYSKITEAKPSLQWKSDLTKDPGVPAGTTNQRTYYTLKVEDRCGNAMWEQQNIPHVSTTANQSITYGDAVKGTTTIAPKTLQKGQIYSWSISGEDTSFTSDFIPANPMGWNYLGLNLADNDIPTSAILSGLTVKTENNNYSIGIWQSPDTALSVKENDLYRVRYSISSPNASVRGEVPRFRARINSTNFGKYDILEIVSRDDGNASPLAVPQNYDVYLLPDQFADFSLLAFDVINADPDDKSDAELSLDEITIQRVGMNVLKGYSKIAEYDFITGDEGWKNGGTAAESVYNGALNIKGDGNIGCFGFWTNPFERIPYTYKPLYKLTCSIKSNTDKERCPEIRLRMGSSDQLVHGTMGITSASGGELSPDINGREYTMFFAPPYYLPSPAGFYASIDAIFYEPYDDLYATIFIDDVKVEKYNLPFND